MKKKNILLLTIDTLRADMLGCYGHGKAVTPNLDRLASEGARFETAITGGSWTQAAFPTILTSTTASSHGGCLGPLAISRPSPVASLQANGYRTFGFSSSPLLSKNYGYDRGFTDFKDPSPGERDPWLRRIKGGEHLLRHPLPHALLGMFGFRTRPAQLYLTAEEIADEIDEWLVPGEQPFFGWVHYMDVHWPYHREKALKTAAEIAGAWRDIAHLYRVNWKGESIEPGQIEHYLALYEDAIRYTDLHIGRLLDRLDAAGLANDTVILVVADHGEEFLERGRWGHFEVNLHDEIVKVPLIIRDPEQPAGRTIGGQVSTLDIMPTVLDLAGIPHPAGMQGISLVPSLAADGPRPPERIAISEMWRDHWHILALRTERFKFIWNSRFPENDLLYDLAADPGEMENVIENFPVEAADFKARVSAHLEEAAATAPSVRSSLPDHDDEMLRRLRDLGYLE